MLRSFEAYVWDIQDRGQQIIEFVGSTSEVDYLRSNLLRAAVERNLEVIGEALVLASRHFPDQLDRLPDRSRFIAVQNQLANGYNDLDHHQIWIMIQQSLPQLLQKATEILEQKPPKV
jgi:uncharacterized protein with HEPN domain